MYEIFGDQEYTFSDIKIVNIAPGSKTEVKIVAIETFLGQEQKNIFSCNFHQFGTIVNHFPLV